MGRPRFDRRAACRWLVGWHWSQSHRARHVRHVSSRRVDRPESLFGMGRPRFDRRAACRWLAGWHWSQSHRPVRGLSFSLRACSKGADLLLGRAVPSHLQWLLAESAPARLHLGAGRQPPHFG